MQQPTNLISLLLNFTNDQINILKQFNEQLVQLQTNSAPILTRSKNTNNRDFVDLCGKGKIDDIKILAEQPHIDINFNSGQPIRRASYCNRDEIVKFLLEKGADPSWDDNYAIQMACYYGNIEMIKTLLQDSRVDLLVKNNICLQYAIERGHTEVIKIIVNDPRSRCKFNQILYTLIKDNDMDKLKSILEHTTDIEHHIKIFMMTVKQYSDCKDIVKKLFATLLDMNFIQLCKMLIDNKTFIEVVNE